MKRLWLWSLAAWLAVLPAAIRHRFFWGALPDETGIDLPSLLSIGETILLAAFAWVAGGSYLRASRLPELRTRPVLVGGVLLTLAATLVPPWVSTDVFDYLARGRVEAWHGANPYLVPPRALPDVAVARAEWSGYVMPYGPVAAVVQLGVAGVSGHSDWIGVYLFKLLFALCHVATAWQLRGAVHARRPELADRALLLWLWNPYLLLECAGSGHNEALLALCLATMARALAERRFGLATLAFGLGAATKHGCAPLGPLLLALAWRERQLPAFGLGLLGTAAVLLPLGWHYFAEPGALAFLARQLDNRQASLQYFTLRLAGDGPADAVAWVGRTLVLLAILRAALRLRTRHELAGDGATVMLLFLLLAMPLFSPWYHIWWLPLIGLSLSVQFVRTLQALAILGPASYLVQVATREFGLAHQLVTWTLGLLLVLVAARVPDRWCQTPVAPFR